MGTINGDARELVEMIVGLVSRIGWQGTARVVREGEGYLIALRVHRRPVEVPERELRRRARVERG